METTPVWRLDWDESLSMNLSEIDAEHQHFIQLVNELNEAIIGRLGQEELRKRIQSILDDAAVHFANEEALFKKWGYPDAEAHTNIHAEIMRVLCEINGSFKRDMDEYTCVEAGLAIKQTLIQHLLSEDIKYRDYRVAQEGQLSRPMP